MAWASCLKATAAVKVVAAADTGLRKQETFTCDSHTEGQKQNYGVKTSACCLLSGEPPSAPSPFHSCHGPALCNPLRKCHALSAMVGRGHATQAGALDTVS